MGLSSIGLPAVATGVPRLAAWSASPDSSSISMRHSPAPTLAISPSFTIISLTTPSYGLVISTVALSLWTSHNGSNVLTTVEGLTDLDHDHNQYSSNSLNVYNDKTYHLITSHSVIPSPISANKNGRIAFLEAYRT